MANTSTQDLFSATLLSITFYCPYSTQRLPRSPISTEFAHHNDSYTFNMHTYILLAWVFLIGDAAVRIIIYMTKSNRSPIQPVPPPTEPPFIPSDEARKAMSRKWRDEGVWWQLKCRYYHRHAGPWLPGQLTTGEPPLRLCCRAYVMRALQTEAGRERYGFAL